MDPKELKSCEPPTLIGALETNRNLISECLEVTGAMYADFTSDASVKTETKEPTCVMADIMGQTQDLRILLDLLLAIKNQIR